MKYKVVVTKKSGERDIVEFRLSTPVYVLLAKLIKDGWDSWSFDFSKINPNSEDGGEIVSWDNVIQRARTMIETVGFDALRARLQSPKNEVLLGIRLASIMATQGV